MTDEEHLENTAGGTDGHEEQSFDVFLPLTETMDGNGATHVAHLRGDRDAYLDVLAGFVATGSDLSEPLRSPIGDLDDVRFALDGLGPARVESVDLL
jgi:hypothetical protein